MGIRIRIYGLGLLSKWLKKEVDFTYEKHTDSKSFFIYTRDEKLTVRYKTNEGK